MNKSVFRPLFFLFFIIAAPSFAIETEIEKEVTQTIKKNILAEARWALKQAPLTVTANTCPRSAGTKHDFYSEGDYWWPDSLNPDGPYIQRDGMTNPENFVAHRQALIRFSKIVGALASAYKLTHDKKYINHAFKHINAWFVDPETRMNPSLLFAQAIKDTIHLMEVAQGIKTTDGKGIKKAIEYLYPFVEDKSKWPLKPDVMYWDNWPIAHPFLVFGANAFKNSKWLRTWKRLDHDPKVEEVIRNLPIRNPIIWF